MAIRTRNRSPLSTHFTTTISGRQVLVHAGRYRAADLLADSEIIGVEGLLSLTVTDWETGDLFDDLDALASWWSVQVTGRPVVPT